MSTINPNTIDVTKPEEGEATTASVRANEQATKDNFSAAKIDIEGLESGKEDAGTADAAVSAHNLSGAAHGGVEGAHAAHAAAGNPHSDSASLTDFTNHKGSGGTEHPTFTQLGVAGFAPGSSGGTSDFLRADGAWAPPPGGGAGTYNEVEKDSASQSVGRAKIDFRDTGDATVVVTDDPANDRTIVTIDATAGGGGGGIGKGTPFVVGDVLEVESDAGDGSARSTGITTVALSGHLGDGTIHFTEGSIDHTQIQNVGTNSHAQIDTHIGDGSVHFTEASITHNNVGGRTTADAHPTGAITGLDAALAAKLENLVEDATPQLGGNLQTQGNLIEITRSDDSVQGLLAPLTSELGAALVYSTDGAFTPGDGAIVVKPGITTLSGTVAHVESLEHATPGGRVVHVGQGGNLYAVDLPAPGWTENDTDAGSYDLGAGLGAGAWVELTNLDITIPQTVEIGDRLDVSCRLWTENKTTNRTGSLEVWFGIEATTPGTPDASQFIAPGFAGYVNLGFAVVATSQLTAGTVVTLYARRNDGDHAQFGLDLVGTPNAHEYVVSTPGAGGGGGGGDVIQGIVGSDGDVLMWGNAAGKIASSAGFLAANIARRDALNTFAADQRVEVSDGAQVTVKDLSAGADLKTMVVTSEGGVRGLLTLTDAGALLDNLIQINAASNIVYGSYTRNGAVQALSLSLDPTNGATVGAPLGLHAGYGTLNAEGVLQQGINIRYPADRALSGGTPSLTLDANTSDRVVLTHNGLITPTPPASGEGSLEVIVADSGATLSLGSFTTVRGSDPGAEANRIAYVTRLSGGDTIWAWGV